ncbi:hypothetical protein AVEN_82044-1 [Araneus ventricosus]|uniref:Uncharacterized protein n=1 Tax=Araneus ventricosus TaxID=182803 RepID=A0A4Y2KIH2_ARAVE|nr:hypothetical protein AVEN_82044-1 [Araneus ventricosus]
MTDVFFRIDWQKEGIIEEVDPMQRNQARTAFLTSPSCLQREFDGNAAKLGLSWDASELPLLITERFERWKMKLPKLNALQIPGVCRKDFTEDSKCPSMFL